MNIAEAFTTQFLEKTKKIVDVNNRKLSKPAKVIVPPIKFTDVDNRQYDLGAEYGEHTEEILFELGYSPIELDRLEKEKIIFRKDSREI